jgi:hypothetical protein
MICLLYVFVPRLADNGGLALWVYHDPYVWLIIHQTCFCPIEIFWQRLTRLGGAVIYNFPM